MTRTLPAVFALAILVSPAVAVAQTTGTRLADVVATGMKVSVVDDDGRRIEGRVLDHSGESLRLSLNGSSQEIPIDRIVRIDKPDSSEEWCPRGTWHWAGRRHVWRRPFVKRKHRTGVDARGHCVPNCRLDAVRHWHRRHVQQPSNALRARRTSPGPRLARRRARRPRRGGIGVLVASGSDSVSPPATGSAESLRGLPGGAKRAPRGRAARGPVEPHGGARAPVGCPATGPGWVPAAVIQRTYSARTAARPPRASPSG